MLKIDGLFLKFLKGHNPALYAQVIQGRSENRADFSSDILLDLAPHVQDFVGELFCVEEPLSDLKVQCDNFCPLEEAKRVFVRRRAAKAYSLEEVDHFEGGALRSILEEELGPHFTETTFAKSVLVWLKSPKDFEDRLDTALRYAAWVLHAPQAKKIRQDSVLFSLPQSMDFENLAPPPDLSDLKKRDGFGLTDPGPSFKFALDQAHYCLFCHERDKDDCRKGSKNRAGEIEKNPLGESLEGCPLDQKISEMNLAFSRGHVLGSLAIAMIDNPLLAATGHRICQDCSRSCIFQKQEAVDIPALETQILKSILNLPWGVEIYALLTRWNPLKPQNFLPQEDSGYKVLVVGLGPAGFGVSHYLTHLGHTVVGIDGLKIEPLPEECLQPVYNWEDLRESLDQRTPAGFGGVAEYGITVRWDKNYLKLIRLILERRHLFQSFGGVRLGSQITLEQALDRGFDHIALCVGAGLPTTVPLKNNLIPGVRQASDFLMALQLMGGARDLSPLNLQIRLPIAVIGGGLTAVDSATEALSYYAVQVERFVERYEILAQGEDEKSWRNQQGWSEETNVIVDEFLDHGRALGNLRQQQGKEYDPLPLLQKWGGATLVYRRAKSEAPSYRLNHKELVAALREGVQFLEHKTPVDIIKDRFGAAQSLSVQTPEGAVEDISAKTILVAAGTHPNTFIMKEEPQAFHKANPGLELFPILSPESPLIDSPSQRISCFGDVHPSFSGSVVKALASAKKGVPEVDRVLRSKPASPLSTEIFFDQCREGLSAHVLSLKPLTPKTTEIIVKAPWAAENFRPGQFFRFQNYETNSDIPPLEGIALSGVHVDTQKGHISLIVLNAGSSTQLCSGLKVGEPVVLMGPTGTPSEIPENKTVLLVGSGLGNVVLLPVLKSMKEKGCRIVYLAAYRDSTDIFKKEDLEIADHILWTFEAGIAPNHRSCDAAFQGNAVEALKAYQQGDFQKVIPLSAPSIEHLFVVGSPRLAGEIQKMSQANFLPNTKGSETVASHFPLQCMMKEICAQCLQKHVDPETGQESLVFSCAQQDQCLQTIDLDFLQGRLRQNQALERLNQLFFSLNS
ncbi:MAG: FAD-dependent oxidoreductase [bacterium]|nr:FAD-dependent oxidoreductase [bacterium]